MRYKYRALDTNGEIIEDSYTANSKEEVVKMIKSKRLIILSIEEELQINLKNVLNNRKIRLKDLVVFCKLIYTMLNAGISITNSLEIMADNMDNIRFKSSLMEINHDIHKGLNLSDAIARQNHIFPILFVEMVRAGEASGNLEEIFLRLGDYYNRQNKIKNKIKNSLVYPILLITLTIGVVIFMLAFIFPIFYNMYASRELSLPLPTKVLIYISYIIRNHLVLLIVALGLNAIVIRLFFRTYNGKIFLDYVKLKLPFIRNIYIKTATANLTKTLSILLSAGIPLIKSLEMASSVVNNIIIKNKLDNEIIKVEQGKLLSDSVKDTKIFSSVITSMINVGEETGKLDELLLKASVLYDEMVETSLEKLTKLIEPVLMIVVGFIIGFIVISIALPMFDSMYPI